MIYKIIAVVLIILCSPLFIVLYIFIRLTSDGPFIFKQRRLGKNKKPFVMYKIRTMVVDAEDQKSKIQNFNEADGPVFKIRNDPRYTLVGKFISHSGLDELPQLINIIKGEMSFVGPRPLPIEEAQKIPKKYDMRFSVLPGITSLWVIRGSHKLSFDEWMKLDLDYVKRQNPFLDFRVAVKTIQLIGNTIMKELFK
jgi:lipopolysaccharide/colanic/teichoic acid biosynthesis glycosyltransferase